MVIHVSSLLVPVVDLDSKAGSYELVASYDISATSRVLVKIQEGSSIYSPTFISNYPSVLYLRAPRHNLESILLQL